MTIVEMETARPTCWHPIARRRWDHELATLEQVIDNCYGTHGLDDETRRERVLASFEASAEFAAQLGLPEQR